jgi:hypothetical protein
MTYLVSAVILACSTLFSLSAQEHTFQWYNEKTYQLYEQQQWSTLIEVGREALRRNYDYFYLRMRLGWAFYQQRRYRMAARQYYRALGFNSHDPIALEMLHYSLLYGGRPQEAWLIRRQWPNAGPSPFLQIRSVQGEAGIRSTQQDLPVRQLEFFNGGFSHQLGAHLLLQHQYQFLRQHFQHEEVIMMPPQGHRPPHSFLRRTETTIDQHEYLLGAIYQFRNGWVLHGAYHPIWYTDTLGAFHERAFSLALSKDWSLLRLTGGLGFADISGQAFRQYQLRATFYPLGNTHLYYRAAGILKDGYEPATFENRHWVSQQLGFRLFKNAWLEGLFSFGQAANFFEEQAAIVYNLPDPIEQRYGGSFQYWIEGRHLFYVYLLQEHKIFAEENLPFRQFTVLAGLQFNFGSP